MRGTWDARARSEGVIVVAGGGRDCSIAAALGVIGERWSLLAMREVMLGERRFDQIARNTGASRDILTTRPASVGTYS